MIIVKRNKLAKRLFDAFLKNRVTQAVKTTNKVKSFHCAFYEWGNIYDPVTRRYNTPLSFSNRNDLLDYLKSSHITVTEEQINMINKESWVYATCPNGVNSLVLTTTYYSLEPEKKKIEMKYRKHLLPSVVVAKG